jgi:hypothetical protein
VSTAIYLSASVAAWAKQTLRDHDLAEGGWWCKGCYREGNGKIVAGKCQPYVESQAIRDAHRRPSRPRPRPGERVWFRS